MSGREAFVSLATNDFYAKGALALGHSIRQTHTSRRLALLVTNSISPDMRRRLERVWDELVVVEELDSGDTEHLALLSRPELGVTFSKLHAWCLTQYTKCVFLDADTLVLQNVDELFDREELSAAPDIGWPDCFNSGVFVFEPSKDTFNSLVAMARQTGSFDGGDQGLLNMFWSDWATKDIKHHLPFIYNVTPNVSYGYTPAYLQFLTNIKIVHFIGPVKPWQHHYVIENGAVIFSPGTYASQQGAYDFIKRWWETWTSLEQSDHPGGGGVGRRGPPPAPAHPHHSHPHRSLIYTQPPHTSTSQSMLYVPHPLSTGHYDLPQDSYFVDTQHSEPFSPPPPSHSQPPATEANLNPETARFQNLMSIPYSDHHAHTSLSFYSKPGRLGGSEPAADNGERKRYNFDTDVGVDQISLRRQLSFPYFYSPSFGHSSSFHSPILRSHHLHSGDIEFPNSLTTHDNHDTHSLHSSSSHSLEFGGTENDDDIMIPRSRDSHVIQLPELRQPAVRISDSVLPYLKMSPFSPTHTTQSPLTPVTTENDDITAVGVATPPTQEMGATGGEGISAPAVDQHRLDFQNGRIDYHGRDSFENIQQRIDAILLEDEEEEKELGVGDEPDQEAAAGAGEEEEEEGGVSGETGQEEAGIDVTVPEKAGGE